jgi:very-short-patch-repair endonuclease
VKIPETPTIQVPEVIPVGYCQCGCGRRTTIAKETSRRYGHVKGQPVRFINGHQNRSRGRKPNIRTEMAALAAIRWKDPAAHDQQSASATRQMAAPAARELASVTNRTRWAEPDARAQQSENHRRLGIRVPPDSAYSGGPTECEALLLEELQAVHPGWVLHHRVPGMRRSPIDLVLPSARLAVEVDGWSHRYTAQRARDRRKEESLLSRGYLVIRVSNDRVLTDLEEVVAFITAVATRPTAEHVARPW